MARNWLALRSASFKGVPFKVDDDGPDRGRRVAVHEISGGEAPVTEDMGKRATEMFVMAYVASDLADIEGLALEAICDSPGPGLLILPIDPPVMMHCTSCSRDRRKDRSGFIAYRLDFVEAGGFGFGVASPLGALRDVFAAGVGAAANAMKGLF